MLTSSDLSIIVAAASAGILLCVLCCFAAVLSEMRQCFEPPWRATKVHELKKFTPLDKPLELIGARPDDERPSGVDWTISTWASKRGEYDPCNRGYTPVAKVADV